MSRSSEVATPLGPARVVTLTPNSSTFGTVALGHGAGGGCEAVDLQAVALAACGAGWQVMLIDQPWRVAGRRVAVAPAQLDRAWIAVLTDPVIRASITAAGPLVVGGRSAGARVACRTATAVAADAVCALAFPLHPPGRPERTRAAELLAAAADHPVLVVQGRSDAFGAPAAVAALGVGEVVAVPGDHSLKADPAAVATAVTDWLRHRSIGRP